MTQTTIATEPAPPTIDELARKWTQAKDLATLLEPGSSYFPSLYPSPCATPAEVDELRRLADAYDAAQAARGDSRRAHRGLQEWWVVQQPQEPEGEGCEGHPAGPADPMGQTVYCDGSCRRAPAAPRRRAWTDAYQVGQRVLYVDRARTPGRVLAILPARADLSTTLPAIWQTMQRQVAHDRPVAPVRQTARLVVALDPVPGGEAILRVVAQASALADPR